MPKFFDDLGLAQIQRQAAMLHNMAKLIDGSVLTEMQRQADMLRNMPKLIDGSTLTEIQRQADMLRNMPKLIDGSVLREIRRQADMLRNMPKFFENSGAHRIGNVLKGVDAPGDSIRDYAKIGDALRASVVTQNLLGSQIIVGSTIATTPHLAKIEEKMKSVLPRNNRKIADDIINEIEIKPLQDDSPYVPLVNESANMIFDIFGEPMLDLLSEEDSNLGAHDVQDDLRSLVRFANHDNEAGAIATHGFVRALFSAPLEVFHNDKVQAVGWYMATVSGAKGLGVSLPVSIMTLILINIIFALDKSKNN